MSETQAPKFNLTASNLGITDDKLQEEMDRPAGKFFGPGNYDLEIVAADFHKNKETGSIYCNGDDTWFNVKVTFRGVEDRETTYWVQVPTSQVTFGKKKTYFVFKKFAEFMAAIGAPVAATNLSKIVPKFFADPKAALKGLKVNADIGFEGPYIDRVSETEYRIVRGDKAVTGDDGEELVFPDNGSAKAAAQGLGIKTSFASILKFTPKAAKASKPKAAEKTAEGENEDTDW